MTSSKCREKSQRLLGWVNLLSSIIDKGSGERGQGAWKVSVFVLGSTYCPESEYRQTNLNFDSTISLFWSGGGLPRGWRGGIVLLFDSRPEKSTDGLNSA